MAYKTDIEIAQECQMKHITEIAIPCSLPDSGPHLTTRKAGRDHLYPGNPSALPHCVALEEGWG